MRSYGPNGTALAAMPTATRRTASGSFAASEDDAPRNSTTTGFLRTISTVDALIALPGLDAVLGEIDLRVTVQLGKVGVR